MKLKPGCQQIFFSSMRVKHDKQINAVVRTSYFHLRQLSKIKYALSLHHFEILIHAFVTTRLDYCNALQIGISQSLLTHLQMVQHAAARLLTGSWKYDHISPTLAALHWLTVLYQIYFIVFCLFGNV